MLIIRFSRIGKTKQPTYRLIVSEKTKDPWGKYLEKLGIYNPRSKVLRLDAERIKYWLSKGAQASDTVHNLLIEQKIITGDKCKKVKISKKRKARIASATPSPSAAPVKFADSVKAPTVEPPKTA